MMRLFSVFVFVVVLLLSILQPSICLSRPNPVTSSKTVVGNGNIDVKIEQKSWNYKGHFIGYEVATTKESTAALIEDGEDTAALTSKLTKEPILLLNGFGVGSFHQHRLIPQLLQADSERLVYGIDYLGQGRSWPVDCHDGDSVNENGLVYSADTWIDQIIQFIEQVILRQQPQDNNNYNNNYYNTKIHLVGNSVGGYLAVALAVRRPDLISTISLLNATPVWGLNLPGWDGVLPPPSIPRWIGRKAFDFIRDLGTIDKYLNTAYANSNAYDELLMRQIRACTEGKGGHAAFASIMWSPPATMRPNAESQDFFKNLLHVKCDVLLIFGEQDPWCKPAFAKKMMRVLSHRPPSSVCRYVQLSNVGHCPNHEAPKAVAKAVSSWIAAGNQPRTAIPPLVKPDEEFREDWAVVYAREMKEQDIRVGLMDLLAVTFV